MTPLELSYPIIGLIFALGGGIYAWQTRRNCTQAMADFQAQQQARGQSVPSIAEPPAIAEPTSEAVLHIQGKLRHLEQDLQKSQTALQATLAARDELSHNYQAQEKVVARLRHQLTQQQAAEGDRLKALQQQNQELRQENSNLSDRLRQSVNSLAEARPKLLKLEAVAAKNQELTEQLQQVHQDRQADIAQQVAERETVWQQQHQGLREQVDQLTQQIQQLTVERDHAQQDLRALKEQGETAQEQVKTLTASLQALTQAQQDWHKEREQLTAKVNNLDATQKSLALTNQELTVKLETTQAQGDRLKAEKKEQTVALQGALADVATLQQQLAELQETQAQSLAESVVEAEPEPVVEQSQPTETVTPEPEPESESESVTAVESTPEPEPEPVIAVEPTPEPEPEPEPLVATELTAEPESEPEPLVEPESPSEPETTTTVAAPPAHAFTDKKVVILGTLNAMNREIAKTRLQDLGAHYTSAPSSKTDYVVVGKAPGAKLKKAQKLGIPQLSEAQFLEMIGD
ncbi:MAG: BRCT domain-containing protein [Synechocystis sp.]|nr:BRCT domain-containing protein [Synechocystis sp.]